MTRFGGCGNRRIWERRGVPKEKIRTRREVIKMDWKTSSPEQKAKWLTQQKEDIRRAKALLETFESVTEKWLTRLTETKKSK